MINDLPPASGLVVRSTPKGRAVFATRAFAPGERVERCAVIVVDDACVRGELEDFAYVWGERVAVVTGFGSLYNHSFEPNARYDRDFERQEMVYSALGPIAPGDEVTINYNGDPSSREPVWFEVLP